MRIWTAAQIDFLEEHTGVRSSRWIARQLTRRFAERFSEESVIQKQKRLGWSRRVRGDGMTMMELEAALGVHHRLIASWVRAGKLRCRRLDSDRTPQQGGPPYEFDERDVLAFLRHHRHLIRLDRVDRDWFLSLVLPPRVEQAVGHMRPLREAGPAPADIQ